MSHTDFISDTALENVAAKLGSKISGTPGIELPSGAEVTLHESFSVWMLPLAATAEPEIAFDFLADNTSTWYHQIHINGSPSAYAITEFTGPSPDEHKFAALAGGKLPSIVHEAINLIDERIENDPLVRFLSIPAYFINALWLQDGEHHSVFVLDKPPNYDSLKTFTPYPAREFVKLLANQEYIAGLPPNLS